MLQLCKLSESNSTHWDILWGLSLQFPLEAYPAWCLETPPGCFSTSSNSVLIVIWLHNENTQYPDCVYLRQQFKLKWNLFWKGINYAIHCCKHWLIGLVKLYQVVLQCNMSSHWSLPYPSRVFSSLVIHKQWVSLLPCLETIIPVMPSWGIHTHPFWCQNWQEILPTLVTSIMWELAVGSSTNFKLIKPRLDIFYMG